MGNADDRSQSRPRRPWHNPNFNLGTLLSGVLAAIVGVTWLVGLESTSDKRWELYEAHRAADKELHRAYTYAVRLWRLGRLGHREDVHSRAVAKRPEGGSVVRPPVRSHLV